MGDLGVLKEGKLIEGETVSGDSSYPSGGYTFRSQTGLVRQAVAEANSVDYTAHATVSDSNEVSVVVSSADTGGEVSGGTDLSGEDFTVISLRM